MRDSDKLTVGCLDDIDELENEDMVRINIEDINKSMNSINFGEFHDHYFRAIQLEFLQLFD